MLRHCVPTLRRNVAPSCSSDEESRTAIEDRHNVTSRRLNVQRSDTASHASSPEHLAAQPNAPNLQLAVSRCHSEATAWCVLTSGMDDIG